MEKNNHKTKTVRELGTVDIMPLIKTLPLLVREWDKEEDFALNQNKKKTLSQVQHINFRWSDKKKDPVAYLELPLWNTYKDALLPVLTKAVEPLGYAKGYFPRVILAKMQPGAAIPEHIDGSVGGWIAHKIHIPLITNEKAIFFVDGKIYHFEKGAAYEVNNGAMHAARNDGETARVHLIFEYLDASINDVPGVDVTK